MSGFGKFNVNLQQDVSRKELLRYASVALLCLIGVAAILQGFGTLNSPNIRHDVRNTNYSTSVYGR